MNTAYLLMGGNIGDTLQTFEAAKELIKTSCGPIVQQSSVYQTAAWGLENQNDFLNQVLQIRTTLDAHGLLKAILRIEELLGRKRELPYGPRTIDIDMLFFNDDTIQQEDLTVPHPRLHQRRFVLVPMAEIAPELVHPVLKKTIAQLLAECPDPLAVQKFR